MPNNEQPRRLLEWNEASDKETKQQREQREKGQKFRETDPALTDIFRGLTQLTNTAGRVTLARAFGERTFPIELDARAVGEGVTARTHAERWASSEYRMFAEDSATIHLLLTDAGRPGEGNRGPFVAAALLRQINEVTRSIEADQKQTPPLPTERLERLRERMTGVLKWLQENQRPNQEELRVRILQYLEEINRQPAAQDGRPPLDIAGLQQANSMTQFRQEFYRRNPRIPLAERGVNTVRELLVELSRLRTEAAAIQDPKARAAFEKTPRQLPQRMVNLLQYEGIPAAELFANPNEVTLEQLQRTVFTQLECMGFNVSHLREQDRELQHWQTSLLLGNITNISLTQRLEVTSGPLERAREDMRRITTFSLMIWNDIERFTEMTDRYMELCASRQIAVGERGRITAEEDRLRTVLVSLNAALPHYGFFHRVGYHIDFVVPTEDRYLQQLDLAIQQQRKGQEAQQADAAALRQQNRPEDAAKCEKEAMEIGKRIAALIAMRDRCRAVLRNPNCSEEERKKARQELSKTLEASGVNLEPEDAGAHAEALMEALIGVATMNLPAPEMNVVLERLPPADRPRAEELFAAQQKNHEALRVACDDLGQSTPTLQESMRVHGGLPYAERAALIQRVNAIHQCLNLRIRYDLGTSTNPRLTVPGRIPGPLEAAQLMMPRMNIDPIGGIRRWWNGNPEQQAKEKGQDAAKKKEEEAKKKIEPARFTVTNNHAQLPGGMFYNLLAADMQEQQRLLVREDQNLRPAEATQRVTRYLENAEMFRRSRRSGLQRTFANFGTAAVRALRPTTDLTEPLNDAQQEALFRVHRDRAGVLEGGMQGLMSIEGRQNIDLAINNFQNFHLDGIETYMRLVHDVALNINEDGVYAEMTMNTLAEIIGELSTAMRIMQTTAYVANAPGALAYDLLARPETRQDLAEIEAAFKQINVIRTEFVSAVKAARQEREEIAKYLKQIQGARERLNAQFELVNKSQKTMEALRKEGASEKRMEEVRKVYEDQCQNYLKILGEFFAIGIEVQGLLDRGFDIRVGNAMAIGMIPVAVNVAPDLGRMMIEYAEVALAGPLVAAAGRGFSWVGYGINTNRGGMIGRYFLGQANSVLGPADAARRVAQATPGVIGRAWNWVTSPPAATPPPGNTPSNGSNLIRNQGNTGTNVPGAGRGNINVGNLNSTNRVFTMAQPNAAAAARFGQLRNMVRVRQFLTGRQSASAGSRALTVTGRLAAAAVVADGLYGLGSDAVEMYNAPELRAQLGRELRAAVLPLTQAPNSPYRIENDRFFVNTAVTPNTRVDLNALVNGIPEQDLIIARQMAGNAGQVLYGIILFTPAALPAAGVVALTNFFSTTILRSLVNDFRVSDAVALATHVNNLAEAPVLYGMVPPERIFGTDPLAAWDLLEAIGNNNGSGRGTTDPFNYHGRNSTISARTNVGQALAARPILSSPLAQMLLSGDSAAPAWTQVRFSRGLTTSRAPSDIETLQNEINKGIILSVRRRVLERYVQALLNITRHERAFAEIQSLPAGTQPTSEQTRHILTAERLLLEHSELHFMGSQLMSREPRLTMEQLSRDIGLRAAINRPRRAERADVRVPDNCSTLQDVMGDLAGQGLGDMTLPDSVTQVSGTFEEEMKAMESGIQNFQELPDHVTRTSLATLAPSQLPVTGGADNAELRTAVFANQADAPTFRVYPPALAVMTEPLLSTIRVMMDRPADPRRNALRQVQIRQQSSGTDGKEKIIVSFVHAPNHHNPGNIVITHKVAWREPNASIFIIGSESDNAVIANPELRTAVVTEANTLLNQRAEENFKTVRANIGAAGEEHLAVRARPGQFTEVFTDVPVNTRVYVAEFGVNPGYRVRVTETAQGDVTVQVLPLGRTAAAPANGPAALTAKQARDDELLRQAGLELQRPVATSFLRNLTPEETARAAQNNKAMNQVTGTNMRREQLASIADVLNQVPCPVAPRAAIEAALTPYGTERIDPAVRAALVTAIADKYMRNTPGGNPGDMSWHTIGTATQLERVIRNRFAYAGIVKNEVDITQFADRLFNN